MIEIFDLTDQMPKVKDKRQAELLDSLFGHSL